MYILGKRDAGLYLEQASLKAYLNEGDKWTIETDECFSNCIVATLKKKKISVFLLSHKLLSIWFLYTAINQ